MNPLTSDTLRLRQHVSRSPVARRHANALPTKAAQIPMALPHHERTLATRSVHTLEANISHDTANDPAHQRRRVYASMFRQHVSRSPLYHGATQTPFPPRPRKSQWHCDVTKAVRHTLEANISLEAANDPAHQPHAAFTPGCFALPSGTATRKRTSYQSRANPNGTATSRTYFGHTSLSALQGPFPYYFCTTSWPLLSPAPTRSFPYCICTTNWTLLSPSLKGSLATSESSSEKLFPVLHICTTNWPGLSPAPHV